MPGFEKKNISLFIIKKKTAHFHASYRFDIQFMYSLNLSIYFYLKSKMRYFGIK